mgnify:CR=1 FL=1
MKSNQEVLNDIEKTGFVWLQGCDRQYFEKITSEIGDVIFVTDVKVNPESRAMVTSEKGLDFHTDHHKAKYIAWFCIEQTDKGGESILLEANKLFEMLDDEEQQELRNVRLFEHKVFEDDEDTYPFMIEKDGNRSFYYSFWLAKDGIGEKGRNAIRKFQELTNQIEHIKFKLNPNDLLIIDNHRMLHGRTAIEGSKNRFLKRFWIKEKSQTI